MKRAEARGSLPPLLIAFLLVSHIFAQEAEIVLPEVVTYVPGSVEQKIVITAEEIEKNHFESVPELVERCGIQMLSYGAFGLESKASIRGFTDETVRVVIDGICVNNAQYGTFDLYSINLDIVEKIEIIRGGFTEGVEDEGAVGGVIYITTKKQVLSNRLNYEGSVKTFFNHDQPLDSFFNRLGFEGRLGENTFLNVSGGFNYAANRYIYKVDSSGSVCEGPFSATVKTDNDGLFFFDNTGRKKISENSLVYNGQATSLLTSYFGNGNYFSVGDIFYIGNTNIPGPVNSKIPGVQRDYNNNVSISLWNPSVVNLFNLKNSIAWLCNNRFYVDKKGTENSCHYINSIKYTGTVDFNSLLQGCMQQLIGISSEITNLDSTNDGKHMQFSGVIKETSKFIAGGSEKTGLWTFSIPLSAKFCLNDNKLNFAFVPKTGVAWEIGVWHFSTDIYRMVQFPNMDDLFWEGGGFHGNPDLKPESGWGADFAIAVKNVQIGKKKDLSFLNCGFTIFSDYYKDKIRWGNGTAENLSSAFYLGIDFNFETNFFDGLWTLALNGEYLYNRLLDKENEYTYGKQIMWTPDFVCNFSTSLNFEFVKLSLSATYTGRRYTDNMNLYYLKPYVLVNFCAEGAGVGGYFTPFLKIDNLLNWQYQSVEGYSMPGISLTVGGRFKFF